MPLRVIRSIRGREMVLPSASDFIGSLDYDSFNPLQFLLTESVAFREGNFRFQPEFRIPRGTHDGYMHASLFPGEEECTPRTLPRAAIDRLGLAGNLADITAHKPREG